MLFGYNTPSPVIYVTVLAQTVENHSYVLPGGDNVPKQRPSYGLFLIWPSRRILSTYCTQQGLMNCGIRSAPWSLRSDMSK
ncbi:hypothetical protein AV530_013306 [Patagioenas fasciata monilis]|uniref:Uncharacterized protein n=1 Tax=Patagioenas fasciata monilis TaxID=372326 RepID=A0A1V4JNW2_PATFA|nr:hypothetical protein AV530_013306 [Patagioenas fasciata monilis]